MSIGEGCSADESGANLLMYAVYDSDPERWLLNGFLEEGERAAWYFDSGPLLTLGLTDG